jgi:transposase-like protein
VIVARCAACALVTVCWGEPPLCVSHRDAPADHPNAYPPAVRAAVLADRRASGDSYRDLARRHRVGEQTVATWARQAGLGYQTDEGGPGVN